MKTSELFEWLDDKKSGTSVDVAIDFFDQYQRVLVNIDYRNISGRHEDYISFRDPNNPDLQSDLIKKIPGGKEAIAEFKSLQKNVNDQIEAEAIELVAAFKAMINVMLMEGRNNLSNEWHAIWDKFKDNEEIKNELSKIAK